VCIDTLDMNSSGEKNELFHLNTEAGTCVMRNAEYRRGMRITWESRADRSFNHLTCSTVCTTHAHHSLTDESHSAKLYVMEAWSGDFLAVAVALYYPPAKCEGLCNQVLDLSQINRGNHSTRQKSMHAAEMKVRQRYVMTIFMSLYCVFGF